MNQLPLAPHSEYEKYRHSFRVVPLGIPFLQKAVPDPAVLERLLLFRCGPMALASLALLGILPPSDGMRSLLPGQGSSAVVSPLSTPRFQPFVGAQQGRKRGLWGQSPVRTRLQLASLRPCRKQRGR